MKIINKNSVFGRSIFNKYAELVADERKVSSSLKLRVNCEISYLTSKYDATNSSTWSIFRLSWFLAYFECRNIAKVMGFLLTFSKFQMKNRSGRIMKYELLEIVNLILQTKFSNLPNTSKQDTDRKV